MKDKIEIDINVTLPDLGKVKKKVKKAVRDMRYDVAAIRDRDPAATSDLEVMLLYSGFHAVTMHRAAHALYKKGHKLSARAISQGARFLTGIEIHPGAKIGKGLVIDHGSGVVIGETAEIGDNCTLYQGVTLGGTGKDTGKRHPTLGDNVMVGSGAKVLGPFKVGSGAKIASNAVVLEEVPENATAVGVPARVVRINGERVTDQLDHVHLPDPVAQEICRVERRIYALEKKLAENEKENETANAKSESEV
ncbi:MAG: serine O-acetyltransferase [Clostridia bacterium]|nr:serine O-acetyltransferase [Clostridia bacterium]